MSLLNLNSRFEQSRPKLSSCSISDSAAFPDKASMNRKTCVNALRGNLTFLLLAFLALCSLPANAAPPPSGVAPVNLPAGGFGIDGNLLPNTPAANVGDWLQSGAAGTGGGVLNQAGVPLNAKTTFHFIDRYGNQGGDLIFSGGLKWTDNPNIWKWTTGKPSSKTEINNALMHIATDAEGHIWV